MYLYQGFFFHGPPAKILEAWKSSEIQIILSKEILEEYQRVAYALAERYPEIDISAIIELIAFMEKLLILKVLKCSSVKILMTINFLNVPSQAEPN